MDVTLGLISPQNYLFGASLNDNPNTVLNWQSSPKIELSQDGIWYCFAKNKFSGKVYRKAIFFNCGEEGGDTCLVRIRRLKRVSLTNDTCIVRIKRLKRQATSDVQSKKIIGVIGITDTNSNALITNVTAEQLCETFGTTSQIFEDWYIKIDENFENGVSVFTDNLRTQKIAFNKVFGVTYNGKNYTFTSSATGTVTNMVECVNENVTTYPVSGFYFTSYNDYNGNVATSKRFSTSRELFNAMYTGYFTGQKIAENIKSTSNGAVNIGDKLYNADNVQITGNCFVGYYLNDSPKFIRLSEGLVAEKGDLIAPTEITGTTVIFPYNTKTASGDAGYGFLGYEGTWWKARLRLKPDQQTIDFAFNDGATGGEFTFNDGTHSYQVKPWFSVGRASKIFGIPNNYKIPDMFRGSWIEILGSSDVTTTRANGESDEAYYTRIGNVETNFNYSFHIYVGK